MTTLLTTQEAADVLKVSLKTIHRLVSSGKIRSARIGTGGKRQVIRIESADLDAFLASCTTPVHDPLGENRKRKLKAVKP